MSNANPRQPATSKLLKANAGPKVMQRIYMWRCVFKTFHYDLSYSSWILQIPGFLRCFRDPIRVPRIREIGSLQVHIGYLTFSLKKNCKYHNFFIPNSTIYNYQHLQRHNKLGWNCWREPCVFITFRKVVYAARSYIMWYMYRDHAGWSYIETPKEVASWL